MNRNVALAARAHKWSTKPRGGTRPAAAAQQKMGWLADCPCPAWPSLSLQPSLPTPPAQTVWWFPCSQSTPAPFSVPPPRHKAAPSVFALVPLKPGSREIAQQPTRQGPETPVMLFQPPLGTAEVCFSERRGAQICCCPRGTKKQQPRNSLTAPEQKLDSLYFPLSFHQLDAPGLQRDRSRPVLLSRSEEVDTKCPALTEGPCTSTEHTRGRLVTGDWPPAGSSQCKSLKHEYLTNVPSLGMLFCWSQAKWS